MELEAGEVHQQLFGSALGGFDRELDAGGLPGLHGLHAGGGEKQKGPVSFLGRQQALGEGWGHRMARAARMLSKQPALVSIGAGSFA